MKRKAQEIEGGKKEDEKDQQLPKKRPNLEALRAKLALKKEALQRAKQKALEEKQKQASQSSALPTTTATPSGFALPSATGIKRVQLGTGADGGPDGQDDASQSGKRPKMIGFDPRLGAASDTRDRMKRKALRFAAPGRFIAQAERQREREAMRAMEAKLSARSRVRGVIELRDVDAGAEQARRRREREPVPQCEWWDVRVLKDPQEGKGEGSQQASEMDTGEEDVNRAGKASETDEGKKEHVKQSVASIQGEDDEKDRDGPWERALKKALALLEVDGYYDCEKESRWNLDRITDLVQHPVMLRRKNVAPVKAAAMPMTKLERKKKRRRDRAEKLKEQQTLQMLGIIPPPPPKVKLSNLHRVLAQESVQDPTQIEREVRKQMQARRAQHEATNQANMLSGEQRLEKKIKKLEDDAKRSLTACVFRVEDFSNTKNEYKVRKTALDLRMTGCYLTHPNFTIVIVEGGKKAMRKYKKLMCRRIDWKSVEPNEVDEVTGEAPDRSMNRCFLVWEGIPLKRAFKNFKGYRCTSEAVAQKRLGLQKVSHYWIAARDFDPQSALPLNLD